MMLRFRPSLAGLTALILALCLAATSLTMAVARGQTRVAGEIVICTGYGIATLSVDAEGRPTGPAHICPDMALGLIAALGAVAPLVIRPEGDVAELSVAALKHRGSLARQPARARSPPALI